MGKYGLSMVYVRFMYGLSRYAEIRVIKYLVQIKMILILYFNIFQLVSKNYLMVDGQKKIVIMHSMTTIFFAHQQSNKFLTLSQQC